MTTEFEVGQTIEMRASRRSVLAAGGYDNRDLNEGTQGEITRVGVEKVLVKFRDENPPVWKTPYERSIAVISFWLPKDQINIVAPAAPGEKKAAKAKTRKLGQAPEGDISPDDPRLQWLWDDAAKLAQRTGYCSQYDRLVDELGIPGRPRDFTVRGKIGGIAITGTIKARNQKEADALFQEKLKVSADA